MSYAEFLASKASTADPAGPVVPVETLHPLLHDWQKEIVSWACRTGRAG